MCKTKTEKSSHHRKTFKRWRKEESFLFNMQMDDDPIWVCVYVERVCLFVCVCMCVCERERERCTQRTREKCEIEIDMYIDNGCNG